jgi:hypothetical protein
MVKSPTRYFIELQPAQREFKLTLTPRLNRVANGVSLNHIIAAGDRAFRLAKKTAGSLPGGVSYPTPKQSAFRGVDHLIVQCSNTGLIDLPDSARHRLIEATLPELLFGQGTTFQQRAHIPGSATDSRIQHLGTSFRVKVQVTVADDGRIRLSRLGRLDPAAHRSTTESEEAGRHNRGRKHGLSFDRSFHGLLPK